MSDLDSAGRISHGRGWELLLRGEKEAVGMSQWEEKSKKNKCIAFIFDMRSVVCQEISG